MTKPITARNLLGIIVISIILTVACRSDLETSQPSQNSNAVPQPSGSVSPPSEPTRSPNEEESGAEFSGTVGNTDQPKQGIETKTLRFVRLASHPGFDRIVFEFSEGLPGYHLEYVKLPARSCGSGEVMQMSTEVLLQVKFLPAQAHDNEGKPTLKERVLKPDLTTVRELKLICDFEADVTWVLGLPKQSEYRVLELENPARVVVDIKK